jgi:low temperature requirement protein LtrA
MTGKRLQAESDQSVTFVELFFDLVFVFAITQLTAAVAADVTLGGLLRSLLLFWLIWWAWTQFTWSLNTADSTHDAVRLITLGATASAFVMALGVPGAFAGDGLLFAVPYVVVRLLGLGLQVAVERERGDTDHSGAWLWVGGSLVGLVLVVAGGVAEPSLRPWLWTAAFLADMAAAAIAGRGQQWDLRAAHFSERHGLFVIIALGESLIVAGTGLTEEARTVSLAAVGAATLLLACVMWWSYFAWLKEALEHAFAGVALGRKGSLARDAFSVAHFPLIGGIIGFAVAIKEILHHPEAPLPLELLAMLGLGVALFTCSAALAYWRLTGRVLVERLAISALTLVALLLVGSLPPLWPLLVAGAGLLAIVVVERVRYEHPHTAVAGAEPLADYNPTR